MHLGHVCADSNLSDQFVWGKKIDRERKVHGDHVASADVQKRRHSDQLRELEKAKRLRVEREAQREAWEAEKVLLDREREQMAYADNARREEEFQLRQSQIRARIRADEGRAKPIDLIANTLTLLERDLDSQTAAAVKPEVRYLPPVLLFCALSSARICSHHS
jgi:hypothetical protein